MKDRKKVFLLIVSLLTVAIMLCGCNQAVENGAAAKKSAMFGDAAEESYDADVSDEVGEDGADPAGKTKQVTENRKIIEYIDFTVETKTFDKLIDSITETVKKSGGYIESSQVGGNSYYDSDNRTAELKIRIPKTKQNDFSDFLAKNSNVVDRSVNTEDVTDQYVDTQSRIKALKIEKATLEKLLSKSSNVSDTLTVYEKLTDVIAQIESYQSRLNQMDSLIDYTTFTVNIEEVEKETKVEEKNWFVDTWNDLLDNLSIVWEGILDFVSFMISSLPYWIILGLNALVVLLIIRHCRKKRAKRINAANTEARQ